jgi:hypothetical protein
MATQFVANPVFQTLPGFVSIAYNGIWTSLASGTAGIGLIIIKYLSQNTRRSINYFLYVAGTAIGLFLLIIAISLISLKLTAPIGPKPTPPFTSFRLDIPADGADQRFDQSDGAWGVLYTYKGLISLTGRTLKGRLEPSTFKTSQDYQPLPGQTLLSLAVNVCHWKYINGNWFVDWSPWHNSVKNSSELNIPLKANTNEILPPVDFTIQAPDDADLSESWLCIRLNFNGGGYFPIPH